MNINPSSFYLLNVTDSCAVQNILSSPTLYTSAVSGGCVFSCTHFVYYECALKPRKSTSPEDLEIQTRLSNAVATGQFKAHHLEIEDLQDVDLLEQRKNLGKGELSSIAFAKKTRQAFLTDDQRARRLAYNLNELQAIQTTPHLFGWLIYENYLGDSDKQRVIDEHESLRKRMPLSKYFEETYIKALEYRLAYGSTKSE